MEHTDNVHYTAIKVVTLSLYLIYYHVFTIWSKWSCYKAADVLLIAVDVVFVVLQWKNITRGQSSTSSSHKMIMDVVQKLNQIGPVAESPVMRTLAYNK